MDNKKSLFFGIIMIAFLVSGCTTTIITRSIEMEYRHDIERDELMAAISDVLIDNGFSIDSTDTLHGIITTDLLPEKPFGTDLFQSTMLYTIFGIRTYTQALYITFKVHNSGYTVYPALTYLDSMYHLPTGSIAAPKVDSWAGNKVNKVVADIGHKLNLQAEIVWLEEVEEITW